MNTEEEVRVLVVDDVSDAAEALASMLECDGYTLKTANSGKQALALVSEFQPHCVLLDINMPGMSGHEVASRLRSHHGAHLVLIAVTGCGEVEDRLSSAFKDFDFYLRKPFDPAALAKVLGALT